MRKLQQLAVVAMTVGSLSGISAGVSFADAPGQQTPQGQPQYQQDQQYQQAPPQYQQQAPQQQAPQYQQQAPQYQQAPPQYQQQAPQYQQVPQQQAPQQQVQVQPQYQQAPQVQQSPPQYQLNQQGPQDQQASQDQQAPQDPQGTQVAPQVSPTVTLPQLPPLAVPPAPLAGPREQNNLFRPYQECSPQSVLQANVPVALLGQADTSGDTCTQVNSAFNQ
jgi:hypothetical protein